MSRIVAEQIELGHLKLQWIIKLNRDILRFPKCDVMVRFFKPVHWNELFEKTDSRKWIERLIIRNISNNSETLPFHNYTILIKIEIC